MARASKPRTGCRLAAGGQGICFQAGADPECRARWFAPAGFTESPCRRDARVGGKWRRTMRAEEDLAALIARDCPAGDECPWLEKPS